MKRQKQGDHSNSNRPDQNSNGRAKPSRDDLVQAFERLAAIADPIEFALEFELERKELKLTQSTFKTAHKAWTEQQRHKGW